MSYKKNNIILITTMVISVIIMMFLGNYKIIKFGVILLDLLVIILLPTKYACSNCFFMLSFPAVYDIYNFKYLFNFTAIITFIKLIAKYRRINKVSVILLMSITIIELVDAILYKYIDLEIITFFSLILSFLTLTILVSNIKDINFLEIFKSLFWGLVISTILALLRIYILNGGYVLSIYTRFYGFFRDPNYYSFFILICSIASIKVCRNYNIAFNYYILIVAFGFLSLSKMFLLSLLVFIFLRGFRIFKTNKTTISKKNIIKKMSVVLIIVIIIVIATKKGYTDSIYKLYTKRIDTQDITTGRLDIIKRYFKALVDNPIFAICGASNTYYYHIITEYIRNMGYSVSKDMTSHNLFVDLVLSWGIVGMYIFIKYLENLICIIKKQSKCTLKKINYSNLSMIATCIICFFALSFLSGDCFPFVILFILYFLFYEKEENKEERFD